ncbi:MAG: DUF11 domain-containing protein, partial [Sedimentisphaerales bacterium]|nr:DUF11 domain-containing protein [Sedimentisphaerales bacterium]
PAETAQPPTGRTDTGRADYFGQTPTGQTQVVTASAGDLQPIVTEPGVMTSSRGRPVVTGTGLVSVADTGGSAFSMIYPRPDYGVIQVDKAMPSEVRLNQPFTYGIKVTNLTDMMLTDIVLTETLSKEFTFKDAEPTAAVDNNKLVWQIDSLGPKASKSFKVSGIAVNAKQLEHCTAITHTVRDCAIVQVVEPTLRLVKTVPSEALLCEAIPVEYTITNTGTGMAREVQIVDTLPAGMQTADGKDKVTLDVGSLLAGESRQFAVKLRAIKVGTFTNKAIASSTTGLKAESDVTVLNVRQPVLTITKSGPQRQYLGRSVAYEITVFNKGSGPARETVVEDIIPPGVTSIEATAGAQFSASKLVWELGTLEPNGSKKVRVSYVPTKEGEVVATATASAYCAEMVTDSAKTIVTGIAAPRLDVVDLEDPVEVGGTTTYVITVTNPGSAADRNIRVTCLLDERLQYVSAAGATAGSVMGRTVNFAPLASLDIKDKATWRVVVRGARPGDALFKATMYTDSLALPVEETEATHIYQQFPGVK